MSKNNPLPNKLTDEQQNIFDKIKKKLDVNSNYSALITGPAGTGKTVLLTHLAIKVRSERGIFFIYTNALRNYLNNAIGKHGTDITEMSTQVETFYKWLFAVYRANVGGRFPQGDFNSKTEKMIEELQAVVKNDMIDFLLIDEGQDFSESVIKLFMKISKKIIFVGDENQSLYIKHREENGGLKELIYPNEEHELSLSIRISPSILKFLRKYVFKIYGSLKTVKRDEDKDSRPLIYKNIEKKEFIDYFISNVAEQYIKADKNLAITCRHNEDVDEIYNKIKQEHQSLKIFRVTGDRDQEIDFSDNAIFCITMYSCKGLEFDNLLFMNIFNEADDGLKLYNNLAYTAYTRAREDLIIYSPTNDIPLTEYLDMDYATLVETLDNEDIDDDGYDEDDLI